MKLIDPGDKLSLEKAKEYLWNIIEGRRWCEHYHLNRRPEKEREAALLILQGFRLLNSDKLESIFGKSA